jgi:hypothetical protein
MCKHHPPFQDKLMLQVEGGVWPRCVCARAWRSIPKERPNKAGSSEPERIVSMESNVFSVGSRVRVTSYGPFRGLKGTIRTAHCLPPVEEPWCFYQIVLEGAYLKEAIWFSSEEIELLSPSQSLASQESRAQQN